MFTPALTRIWIFNIERFSNKIKSMTTANCNKLNLHNEPMKTRRKYIWPATSAGKRNVNQFVYITLIVREGGVTILNQSASVVKKANKILLHDSKIWHQLAQKTFPS